MPKEEKTEKIRINFETNAERNAEIERVKKEKALETTKEAMEYIIDNHKKPTENAQWFVFLGKDRIEDLIKDNTTLHSGVSDMTNALLEKDAQIAILETDNMYLRAKVAILEREKALYERTTCESEKLRGI